jgi:DNA polymerase elongation subunit (family B)
VGKEFNRFKGSVLYEGTTEELKDLIRKGARLEKILDVLHYSNSREGKDLFGRPIEEFEEIKREGEIEGNKGKRAFGKLMMNSSYGKYGQDLRGERYNLTVAVFIAAYARMMMGDVVSFVNELKGKQFYIDTDSIVTDVKLPDSMVGHELGQLKYEGTFDKSIFLGRKQYYLYNSSTSQVKIASKGYGRNSIGLEDWVRASEGEEVVINSKWEIYMLEGTKS